MKIALVDDALADAEMLQECIALFAQETGEELHTQWYASAAAFLAQKEQQYQIVVLDIDMPGMNGMECARRLRETDPEIVIMFVTNMPQYALAGYEVDAVDYMLKPISYADFSLKLRKAMRYAKQSRRQEILLQTSTEHIPVSAQEILYVESSQHYLIYYLPHREIRVRGSMAQAEQQLSGLSFARCKVCYPVNLRQVTSVRREEVVLGDVALKSCRCRLQPHPSR